MKTQATTRTDGDLTQEETNIEITQTDDNLINLSSVFQPRLVKGLSRTAS